MFDVEVVALLLMGVRRPGPETVAGCARSRAPFSRCSRWPHAVDGPAVDGPICGWPFLRRLRAGGAPLSARPVVDRQPVAGGGERRCKGGRASGLGLYFGRALEGRGEEDAKFGREGERGKEREREREGERGRNERETSENCAKSEDAGSIEGRGAEGGGTKAGQMIEGDKCKHTRTATRGLTRANDSCSEDRRVIDQSWLLDGLRSRSTL